MNASTPSQFPSEDGETASSTETEKNPFKKNKTKILVGGAVLAVAVGVAIGLADRQVVTKEVKDMVRKRQPPTRHKVASHQRRLADGRIVDVSGHERGGLAA